MDGWMDGAVFTFPVIWLSIIVEGSTCCNGLLWRFLCDKISLDFGHVMLRKCLNAEVRAAGWIFREDGHNSWRGFFTLSIPTTWWLIDFFSFSFDISGDWKLSNNCPFSFGIPTKEGGPNSSPSHVWLESKVQWQEHTPPVLPVGLGFCVNVLQCSIYWQQSSVRYLLRLFVGEWQTSFECHWWRWGNRNRWQNNPLNVFIAWLGWEGASPALQLLENPWQLQLTCRCWPLRGTHWPPVPSCFCQELAWSRDADGSSGMEAFSWWTPDQIQLSRSDQKLMLCSSQMSAKLWVTLLMPVVTQR